MGIPEFLPFKQLISKSTFQLFKQSSLQQPRNPLFKFTTSRNLTYFPPVINDFVLAKIVRFVANSPKTSIVPLLQQYEKYYYVVKHNDLKKIIHIFRLKLLFDRALEVSEWMTSRSSGNHVSKDLAVRLDLTCLVHGIDAAEKFFEEVNDHSERMYGSLLSCYVKTNLMDKSLSHFKTMKNLGHVTAFAYNNIMTLYMKKGEVEKVVGLLIEMEENGLSPDSVSCSICLKSLTLKSVTTNMEKIMNIIEREIRRSKDWSKCSLVANYFIDEGCKEKAVYYLQLTENRVRDNPVGLNTLITMYSKLGDITQVMRLWRKHEAVCKVPINAHYMIMIGSLVKMDEFQEAERILGEWESSGNLYDFKVPHVLLLGYSRKGLVERAERILDNIISNGKRPIPDTWSIISAGHIKCQNMNTALECMKKALELGLEHQGWVPNKEVISSLLKWLGDGRELREVDQFVELLTGVVPMDQEMFETLLLANIRHGNEVGDVLLRMSLGQGVGGCRVLDTRTQHKKPPPILASLPISDIGFQNRTHPTTHDEDNFDPHARRTTHRTDTHIFSIGAGVAPTCTQPIDIPTYFMGCKPLT